jgi:4-aminobutyrate aminotransferase-like enzyme
MITKAETVAKRQQFLGNNLRLAYKDPIKIVRGSMQYLYDDEGLQYLDAYNNVAHVGHCNPRVVKAGQDQMALLNTNTRYLHDLINTFAERLTETLPSTLSVCFFVNSGSEANELALRLTRAHTHAQDLIVLDHSYHGNTTTLIDISPYKHDGPGGQGPPTWVHKVPLPDLFRGAHRSSDALAATKYADLVIQAIEQLRGTKTPLAGFIAESLPSVAGQIVLPSGYLSRVYEAVRNAGGICIADEVQTGYGRVGTHFWGFESYGVVPDIVVLGKPIGNGHPIGAVVTTSEIAASFDNGMEFFSTFGGNTVSSAIGLAVLDEVREKGLQTHAEAVGTRLLNGLNDLMKKYELIGDVRGSGLFLGVELVRDRETLEPATEEADFIVNRMREHHILFGTDGPFHNVLKIRPPMPFDESDANRLVQRLGDVLSEVRT